MSRVRLCAHLDPTTPCPSTGERERPCGPHLGPSHPLAKVAARLCFAHTGRRNTGVGGVACGQCWEQAIRADERVVVEHGLAREIVPDPSYVDQIAVELACRGERVSLTPADQAAAVARLASRRWPARQIATRLGLSAARVAALLPGAPAPGSRPVPTSAPVTGPALAA